MPEKMAEDLIISFCRPGDLVFDPMCGGSHDLQDGTPEQPAVLGMEICKKYVRLARGRLARAKLEHKQRLDDVFFNDGDRESV